MNRDELLFVPLGGAGEIGLNVYLYGHAERWLMVDLGISFADEMLPGVEIVLPDLDFVAKRREALAGLVLTHAHEDHFGAIPYLWNQLKCPIWCTHFTAAVLRRKLEESGLGRVPVHVVEPGERFDVGPFGCELLHVTHSIPESNALAIRTPTGNLLHTGDWKIDPNPLLGTKTAIEALQRFGDEGVLAMIADSTNILDPGTSGSEAEVKDSLKDLIARLDRRVIFTTFASNVARVQTAVEVAHALGREVCAVGRSMRRMIEAAKEVGYLKDLRPILDERAANALPRERVLWLATGSQGEARAALARMASGQHPAVKLQPDDSVIFSSKIIPGNERTLYNLHNNLVSQGIEVITEHDHFVHVSGHPCRDEVEQMYRWIRPRIAIPVHGEARHLHEHLAFAKKLGVPEALEVRNGDLVRLAPEPAEVIDEVPTGRLVLENDALIRAGDDLFRTRRRLMAHGTVLISLALDSFGSLLAPPQISSYGAVGLERLTSEREAITGEIEDAIEALDDAAVLDDERIREAVRTAVRRGMRLVRDKRPIIDVQIIRLGQEALAGLEEATGVA